MAEDEAVLTPEATPADADKEAAFRALARELGFDRAKSIVWDEDHRTRLEKIAEEEAARPPETREELLATDIVQLDVSVRAFNCLASAGIVTLGDLVHWQPGELLRIRNLGRGSLKEIVQVLSLVGLALRPDGSRPALLPPGMRGYSVLAHGDLADYDALRAAGVADVPVRAELPVVQSWYAPKRPANDRRW